jgi:hypothetical protein
MITDPEGDSESEAWRHHLPHLPAIVRRSSKPQLRSGSGGRPAIGLGNLGRWGRFIDSVTSRWGACGLRCGRLVWALGVHGCGGRRGGRLEGDVEESAELACFGAVKGKERFEVARSSSSECGAAFRVSGAFGGGKGDFKSGMDKGGCYFDDRVTDLPAAGNLVWDLA